MNEASESEPSQYSSPMFFLPVLVGCMFAGLLTFVFVYSTGWSFFVSIVLFASKANLGLSPLIDAVTFGLPIATVIVGFLLTPVSIVVTPSGIEYRTRLKREHLPWDSLRPTKGVPGGAWAPFNFKIPATGSPGIRWIDRLHARQMMTSPDFPLRDLPNAYWEWAGLPVRVFPSTPVGSDGKQL